MATKDQLDQDSKSYSDAFDEDMQQTAEPSEDEAFGLTLPEAPAGEGESAGGPDVAVMVDADPNDGGNVPPAPAAEAPQGEQPAGEAPAEAAPAEAAPQAAPAGDDIEKERQRLRSWEGRLKKLEADLKAKSGAAGGGEQAAAEVIEQVSDKAEGEGDQPLADAADDAAEAVESGAMTAEQAMKMLAEDFGEDFVRMIEAIATAKAREAGGAVVGEKMDELSSTVDEIIGAIVDDKARAHFEAIVGKHPDFKEIGESDEFSAWVAGLPDAERAEAERVVTDGGAKEIVKLLDAYKAAAAAPAAEAGEEPAPEQTDPAVDQAMDDAEGVRSVGLKLPDQPAPASDDYKGAWDQF